MSAFSCFNESNSPPDRILSLNLLKFHTRTLQIFGLDTAFRQESTLRTHEIP